MIKRILLAAAAAAFALAPYAANAAASLVSDTAQMCAPSAASGAKGPRQVTNPATSKTYSLDSQGCAGMALADAAYFRSQGFAAGSGRGFLYAGPFTAQSTTANSPILPPNAYIEAIIIQETTGNAITGGIDIGVAGSSDATIVSAYAVGANAIVFVPSASISLHTFPSTGPSAAQQIFFNAHTNWTDAASINVTIVYSYF